MRFFKTKPLNYSLAHACLWLFLFVSSIIICAFSVMFIISIGFDIAYIVMFVVSLCSGFINLSDIKVIKGFKKIRIYVGTGFETRSVIVDRRAFAKAINTHKFKTHKDTSSMANLSKIILPEHFYGKDSKCEGCDLIYNKYYDECYFYNGLTPGVIIKTKIDNKDLLSACNEIKLKNLLT